MRPSAFSKISLPHLDILDLAQRLNSHFLMSKDRPRSPGECNGQLHFYLFVAALRAASRRHEFRVEANGLVQLHAHTADGSSKWTPQWTQASFGGSVWRVWWCLMSVRCEGHLPLVTILMVQSDVDIYFLDSYIWYNTIQDFMVVWLSCRWKEELPSAEDRTSDLSSLVLVQPDHSKFSYNISSSWFKPWESKAWIYLCSLFIKITLLIRTQLTTLNWAKELMIDEANLEVFHF